MPLGGVRVQQGLLCPPAGDEAQFPPEVHRVLQAEIQSLPANRGMDVRGVARQQHPALPVGDRLPGVVAVPDARFQPGDRHIDRTRPDPAPPWTERGRTAALRTYRVLSRHPVVPIALVTDHANPTSLRALQPLDDMIGAFYESGFDDDGVRQALGAVNSLIFGSLLLTTAGFAREQSTHAEQDQMDVYIRQVDPAKLPHFSRVLPALTTGTPEHDFERALDLLITGLTQTCGTDR